MPKNRSILLDVPFHACCRMDDCVQVQRWLFHKPIPNLDRCHLDHHWRCVVDNSVGSFVQRYQEEIFPYWSWSPWEQRQTRVIDLQFWIHFNKFLRFLCIFFFCKFSCHTSNWVFNFTNQTYIWSILCNMCGHIWLMCQFFVFLCLCLFFLIIIILCLKQLNWTAMLSKNSR